MEKLTAKDIRTRIRFLGQLGVDCPNTMGELVKSKVDINELNRAWEIDRGVAIGIANDIMIWV